jgi:hypothetical protein
VTRPTYTLAAFRLVDNSPICAIAERSSYRELCGRRRQESDGATSDIEYRLLILPTHCWRALVAAYRARAARIGA